MHYVIPPPLLDATGKMSKYFHDLISNCLERDPSRRPSATMLLEHQFFKQAKSSAYLKSFFSKDESTSRPKLDAIEDKEQMS